MTPVLLSARRPPCTAARRPAALTRAADRVAGAAFCSRLDPAVLGFTRRRLADHFRVPEDLVDGLIADRLLRLTTRLSAELSPERVRPANGGTRSRGHAAPGRRGFPG